jgi:glyoxylase-like metal-dependent hydrolase (beta-lactamase superfamily II)
MSESELKVYVSNDPMYAENGYTIYLREGGPCWIIDPGLPPQAQMIADHVRQKRLTPEKILLTHGHADHIAGVDEVRAELGKIPVYIADEESLALSEPKANLSVFFGEGLSLNVDDPHDLTPGARLALDGTTWEVRDVAGHSPGGRALYCEAQGIVIVGDALFAGSVGRVDFPGSSGASLLRNIQENLLTLPDETRVLSGHGPETTIGRERRSNPFLIHGF